MTVAAMLPQLISDWSLTSTEAGWLGGVYFAGDVAAVPVLASLTDRIDARRIYLLSALLGACAFFAFALGTAASFLAGGEVASTYGWRWAFGVAGLGCLVEAVITALALRRHTPGQTGSTFGAASGFARVFRNRRAMGYIIAFFGYAWEVFAFRVWIVVFLAYLQAREADATSLFSPTYLATIIALCGDAVP